MLYVFESRVTKNQRNVIKLVFARCFRNLGRIFELHRAFVQADQKQVATLINRISSWRSTSKHIDAYISCLKRNEIKKLRVRVVNYFLKKIHVRCLTGF